ncbi:MAG: hypothetical protein HYS83_00285 [Candidatus Blackburnbacteria bacterium]|nr:hypothetical protein [Candidatus Blackburnbacteria bacterium]
MQLFQVWQEAILLSWNQVWSSFIGFLPSFIGAILIFVIGILVAAWGRRLIEEILKVLKLEDLSKSSGFAEYLKKAEISLTATQLLGAVVKWLLLLVFFIAAAEILGLAIVSTTLTSLLGYVPNVFAAALILGAGAFIANLADGLVRGALASVDHDAARPVGKLARWAVVLVAFFAAVDQLKIAPALVETFFQGLTWTLVLVLGLSIGLGSKDMVARVLDEWYKKLQK